MQHTQQHASQQDDPSPSGATVHEGFQQTEAAAAPAAEPLFGVNRPPWSAKQIIIALLVIFLCLGGGFVLGNLESGMPAGLPEIGSMAKCRDETLKILDLKQAPTAGSLQEIVGHCYSQVRSQGLLNDFELRKGIYLQQYRANGVLLWMVVSITISGVILAGIQLAASYKLAQASKLGSFGTNDEISLKRDQIVLKSSVTGLFILLISFAFFLVFVLYVYKIDPEAKEVGQQQPVPTLPEGGLGPPPGNPK